MPGTRPKYLIIVIAFLLCLAAVNPVQAASQRARKRAVKQAIAPPPQIPAGPLTPFTLEEIPATPPQVSYHNDQLTIVAQNSTLSDILHAVHQQTGALIEMPGNPSERVVAHFGPGPARDVLAALLNGSHFDYVMLGSAESPTAVAHVILTAKSAGANASPVMQANASQPAPPPQPEQDVVEDIGGDDFASADEEPEGDLPPDQQGQTDNQLNQQQQLPNGQLMRSPEQLLQELQQRQLQQQQQQQNGGQAPPPGAPQGFPIPPDQQAPPQQ